MCDSFTTNLVDQISNWFFTKYPLICYYRIVPDQLSLSQLADMFTESLESGGKSSLTIIAYKNDLRQLVSYLAQNGKTAPQAVPSRDLENFKLELMNKNYTAKSVARKLNAIKGFFRWLTQKGYIIKDPASLVSHPKYELSPPRILSPIEYRALRDAARSDTRIAAIVELLLQTGMRISEVATLKLSDIKPDKINILGREFSLNLSAYKAVEEYLRIRPQAKSEHIFVTKTGRPLLVRNIRAAIERAFAEAGIENATVNDIRNTFIVHQLSKGVDLVTVSRVVGHKRLATTERYLSLIKPSDGEKTNKLGEL